MTPGRLPDRQQWSGRRVLVTGHTGFKGGWLVLMLEQLGARVYGLANGVPTDPSLFEEAAIAMALEEDIRIDVRDSEALTATFLRIQPEVVFHLAAQPLVLEGMRDPVGTFATNVMGTVHVLEASRVTESVRACVVVTTDKVYRDAGSSTPYSEDDELGGHEPYGASKAAAEMAAAGYAALAPAERLQIATVRAGNVIGGGDWSPWRLLPDLLSGIDEGTQIRLRRPGAVRPWQHVLDPITGYILVAETLLSDPPGDIVRTWNFGPDASGTRTVLDVVREVEKALGRELPVVLESGESVDAGYLSLSSAVR